MKFLLAALSAAISVHPLLAHTAPRVQPLSVMQPIFEINKGQAHPSVLFLARDARGTLEITAAGARVLLLKHERGKADVTATVNLHFPGARWNTPRGETPLRSYTNLLLGNDSTKWASRIPHFASVRVPAVYPGIDLVFHSRRGLVEFDFELAPGADPRLARFSFPDHQGTITPDGSLHISTPAGDLAFPKPLAYQPNNAIVPSRFVLTNQHEARFQLGAYDSTQPLVIDPALSYLTYLGGSGVESSYGIAVDTAGNIYVAGATASSNFPTKTGALQTASGGTTDAFVAKFNSTGVLQYSTLIGGRDAERIRDIAVDSQGSIYFCGASASGNFPLANALQSFNKGGTNGLDAIFGKLNPTGTSLVYSSFYGGNYDEEAFACTIDADNNLYLTGYTVSDNFPVTTGAFQTVNRSPIAGNGFVAKIAAAGDKAVFSTYIGGGIDDAFYDLALDKDRNVYVVGASYSTSYPTVGAYQPTNRGDYDAVLTKLKADGTGLLFSTYMGGARTDVGVAIELDANGNIFIVGSTQSPAFPTTANAIQKDLRGPYDTFIAKFDPSGSAPRTSTLFGDNREEDPSRIAIDRTGSVFICGATSSSGIRPVDAVQQANGGGRDAFLLKLNNELDTVQMFTYLGGAADDYGNALALDAAGRILVAGRAGSTDLPTTSTAFQKASGGSADGFLGIIDSSSAASPFTLSTTRLTFTGTAGSTIARQQFSIRAASGTPEWTIDAATTPAGGTWLAASPRSGSGSATIDVSVNTANLAPGSYEGTIGVTNTRLGTRTIIAVLLTLTGGGGSVPDNGVVSAATFSGGPVAPGLLVTIFGSGIGPSALTTAQITAQGTFPTLIADTRVLFDGVAAPLVYVSANQVSAIVPYAVAEKSATSLQVEYKGLKTNSLALVVAATAPGLFTANSSGKGPGAILNQDSTVNSASNPASAGSIVILFGTGEGATDPSGQDGVVATSVYPKPRQPVTVRIGGKEAEVLYAGAAPTLVAGVFQVNVKIPEGLAAGAQPVVVQVGSASSSPDVTVAVQ